MVQSQERLVSSASERYMLVYMIAVLAIVAGLIILFFIVFTKRKNQLLYKQMQQQREFEEALSKTQLEIQEQTFKNIGREIHDNVGQMLTFASMQLNALSATVTDTLKDKVNDTKSIVSDSLQELRMLSKTLNGDVILNLGLLNSVKNEVERLNKLQNMSAELTISGDTEKIRNKNDEIFIFRIIQEAISNTLKYAEADTVNITMQFNPSVLHIEVADNGKGFDESTITNGSGLVNMKSRAELVHANCTINSKPNHGTKITLEYPYRD